MGTVDKNKEYTLKIESVSSEGHGVAHIDGFTVFVPLTAAGDTIRAVITDVQKRFARACITELIQTSKDRCEPECMNYGQCGGCQLRHIQYSKQLEIKKQSVESAMQRIGNFTDFKAEEVIGADTSLRYRNKMVFPIGQKNEKVICGFYAPKSHNIIPLGDCTLGDKLNAQIIDAVKEYMHDNNIKAYDEKTHHGIIRHIFTRKSFSADEIMVVICSTVNKLKNHEKLVEKLRNISDRISSIILNVNTGKLALSNKNVTLWGNDMIFDTLCDIKFEISPNSFFQINPSQTEKLYRKAIDFAQLDKNTNVMDIYCGIGTISLCAAQKAKNVIGIEIVEQAINDAKNNAKLNGIDNVEFYADSAENIVPRLIAEGRQTDVIILDPPRKGSDEKTLNAIVKSKAKRIVYVSCNPATLARDTRFLAEYGYKITRSAVFDLFPHTCHIETVILMEKQNLYTQFK